MATTMTPLQPGTQAAAQACAFAIFGSDIPPIEPEDCKGSWRTTLHVIAQEFRARPVTLCETGRPPRAAGLFLRAARVEPVSVS
ncbi:hypothetical protein [Streptomyces sp. NPDC049915]|uniref:hypothetical protein n=1 Tax=Streptomyces sp. NPDC049915 TaxID=3155510 RepID=UPI0034250DF8